MLQFPESLKVLNQAGQFGEYAYPSDGYNAY